jgi:hypothetical protein
MLARAWDWLIDTLCRALCAWFPSRARLIPTSTDPSRPLLLQFAVMRMCRFGALYLQHFANPELPRFFHRHQWHRMRSFVLSGEFTEERAPFGYLDDQRGRQWCTGSCICRQTAYAGPQYIAHKRLSTYTMGREVIHRTHAWGPRCWTLFWMSSPKLEDWGYYDREREWAFTHWREQIQKRVASLDTGALT